MAIALKRTISVIAVLLAAACANEVTVPQASIMIEGFRFASSQVQPGTPLILLADATTTAGLAPQPFVIRGTSGSNTVGHLRIAGDACFRQRTQAGDSDQAASRACWRAFSDAELAGLVAVAPDNTVLIGFKKAGAEWGVDDQGRNITSEETVQQARAWLEAEGVTIVRPFQTLPGVVGRIQPDPELVARIRNHDNIDYLEADGVGEFLDHSPGNVSLVGIVVTTPPAAEGLEARTGDVVTAEYRRPDGVILRATAEIQR